MTNDTVVIGILAHVDAGKTTLSEGLLYRTESIRHLGRVDKGDTCLDTDEMEIARGITIFSRQAIFSASDDEGRPRRYVLLDTPGHADFSPEMERTLSVLDMAVLVISAADGVTAQVRILWSLLEHYRIPVVIFVNKMDMAERLGGEAALRNTLLEEMSARLSDGIMSEDRIRDPGAAEDLALLDEALLERYMEGGTVSDDDRRALCGTRRLFPVLFGSALKLQGIDELIAALGRYSRPPVYPEVFGARIFKITRDSSGERLTHLKVTGGSLKVRELLCFEAGEENCKEKINQIRLYSGDRFEQTDELKAGMIGAVTGPVHTFAGQGLGAEENRREALIQPVLTWQVRLRMGENPYDAYLKLKQLAEEETMLHAAYDEKRRRITVRMMGRMQRDMLADVAMKRFGLEIAFEQPTVIYKETLAAPVEGVGHFEPLRHYAEVHLLMEPGEPGSGIVLDSRLSTDVLAARWQKQILSSLQRGRLVGVLTGSELTDVKITLVAGRAHEKHTEGGDFYQAAHRAVRQGLMTGESVLLEPWYDVTVTCPQASLGRVLSDLTQKKAILETPLIENGTAVLGGSVSVSQLGDYADEVSSFTGGEGSLICRPGPYRPCADSEAAIAACGYDPEADLRHPSSSVFCSHGAGTVIPWYQVREHQHVAGTLEAPKAVYEEAARRPDPLAGADFRTRERAITAAEDDLIAIFERTYGPIRRELPTEREARLKERALREALAQGKKPAKAGRSRSTEEPLREYLLVDGYNIIFAWEDLRELAAGDIKAARDRLMDILSKYAACIREKVILVFDAYKVRGGVEEVLTFHNITVIFTREAETADQYIEKAARELVKRYRVSVATSDAVEQVIIFGAGAHRLSARDLLERIIRAEEDVREKYLETGHGGKYFLQNNLAGKLKALETQTAEGPHEAKEDKA